MKRLSRLRKRHLHGAQEGSWAVSYGDMITLLLGFYIMYFSIDPPKKGNETLTSSLIEALEKLDKDVALDTTLKKAAAGIGPESTPAQKEEAGARAGAAVESGQDNKQAGALAGAAAESGQDNKQAGALADAAVERGQDNKQAADAGALADAAVESGQDNKQAADAATTMQTILEILLPKDWVEKLSEHKMSAKQLGSENKDASAHAARTKALESSKDGAPSGSSATQPKSSGYRLDVTEIRALDAEASRIGDRVYIMFPQVSFFASASTEITPEGRRALEKFSKVYLPFSGKALLNIVGFSDERPVKAVYRFRDNLELSVLRAVSAQRVAESVGIPLNRTRLMGHGINTKLVEGEEAASAMERWALTRKIMLVIEPEVP
jgi:flagellar motor protein MotB